MTTSTDRPEEVIEQSESENASSAAYIKFPDKPFPHSMLLVFEKYDYSGFASGFDSMVTNTTNNTSSINPNRQTGVGLRSTHSIELPFPKQLTDTTGLIYNNMQQNPLIEGLATRLGPEEDYIPPPIPSKDGMWKIKSGYKLNENSNTKKIKVKFNK